MQTKYPVSVRWEGTDEASQSAAINCANLLLWGLTIVVVLGKELDTIHRVLILHRIVVFQELDNHVILGQMIVGSLTGYNLGSIDIVFGQSTDLFTRD